MVNKKLHKKLDVSRLLASIISSRDTIDILKEAIKKIDVKSIDLDFSNVKFISRSATHALLLMQERLQPKKDISFINTNENVSDMLRMVAANRVVSKKRKLVFSPKKTNIKSLLKEVLA